MRVLNDAHIGALRSAGTTPLTQWQLRKHVLAEFEKLLPVGEDCMILGDLFDTNNVPISDVLATYFILEKWLTDNVNNFLYNVNGNHDASKTSNVMSSFKFLGALLSNRFPDRYVHIEESRSIPYGYVIPHVANQDLFELELSKVPECEYLFVHCNYDNGFAAQSDQSLNMSAEQARECKARRIVFAHEHYSRDLGKVFIPGNQIPTSVSDWLVDRNKRYLSIYAEGDKFRHEYTDCTIRTVEFIEQDWKELEVTGHLFVRVVGEAAADESSKVIAALAKFRKSSEAFVITNAVKILTEENQLVDFESTLKSVQGFSIMEALKKLVTPEEYAILESLCSQG
jgi:hypothetical protein